MGELLHRAVFKHHELAIKWLRDLLDCDFSTLVNLAEKVRVRNLRAHKIDEEAVVEAITALDERESVSGVFRHLFRLMYGKEPVMPTQPSTAVGSQ